MPNHPNDITRHQIEAAFKSPVPDMLTNEVSDCKEGYVLAEVRPHWKEPGEFTRRDFAKFIWIEKEQIWDLKWKRASGRWEHYAAFETLEELLGGLKDDPDGCFFG